MTGEVTADVGHLDVALATAAFAPVFPCLPSKRPATPHGFKDATVDLDRIRAWWARHPDHLVGIPTAGLVVVDLDDDTDRSCTWAWWRATAEAHGWDWSGDLVVSTPGNGVHVYFECPGVTVRNSASKLAAGVDIRGDGGYVIAPGSRLPDGRSYDVLHLADPATAPPWLLDLIDRAAAPAATPAAQPPASEGRGTRYGLGALEAELGRLATAAEGQRNDTLVRAAYRCGQLVAGGQLDAQHAASELHTVAARIGLSDHEIAATIRSGLTSGARQPRRPAA